MSRAKNVLYFFFLSISLSYSMSKLYGKIFEEVVDEKEKQRVIDLWMKQLHDQTEKLDRKQDTTQLWKTNTKIQPKNRWQIYCSKMDLDYYRSGENIRTGHANYLQNPKDLPDYRDLPKEYWSWLDASENDTSIKVSFQH